jgi:Uma2 family endonuclease
MSARLANFVEPRSLGLLLSGDPGCWIGRDPDTVRAPDVAFVAANRAPSSPAFGFLEGAPDLAIEVLSPGDRPGEVAAKVQDWLSAGCKAVWLLDPATRSVTVHRPEAAPVRLGPEDELTGDDLLPGFRLQVEEIFA